MQLQYSGTTREREREREREEIGIIWEKGAPPYIGGRGSQPPWLSHVGLNPHGLAGQGGQPATPMGPIRPAHEGCGQPLLSLGRTPHGPPLSGEALSSGLPLIIN